MCDCSIGNLTEILFKIPEDMQDKEFAAILQDEPQQPLALVPLTEEEQVTLHFSAFTDSYCSSHTRLISSN